MKWFQQHTNALYDPKIVKLIKIHGMAGYGVYHGVNILIAERDADDLTLEHDLNALQHLFNEPLVAEIIETCLNLNLLSKTIQGLLQNTKISKYVGNWQKRKQPTEALQSNYVEPTAKKERREGRERKNELKKALDTNSPDAVNQFFADKAKDYKSQDEKAFDNLKIPDKSTKLQESPEQKRLRMIQQIKGIQS